MATAESWKRTSEAQYRLAAVRRASRHEKTRLAAGSGVKKGRDAMELDLTPFFPDPILPI